MAAYSTFRIGALLLVLWSAIHFIGYFGTRDAQPLNGTEFTLKALLYTYKTDHMGSMRSAGEIRDGLTLAFGALLLGMGALAFVVSPARKAAIVYAIAFAGIAALSLTYWFLLPTGFAAAVVLCFGASALLNR